MKYNLLYLLIPLFLVSCKNDALEKEISKLPINVEIERFDTKFAEASPSDLPRLKQQYAFLFPKNVSDDEWIEQMQDTLSQTLSAAVKSEFQSTSELEKDIRSLFQHLKYYDKSFKTPRIITVISQVDYRNKTIVTDSIVLIALDTYLGPEHEFYTGMPRFVVDAMQPSQIIPNLAADYSERYIFQAQHKTLLQDMIYFGKQLYFKDKMIPFVSDATKIGYSEHELAWVQENESPMWSYLIERELLYSTDTELSARFTADAPFSKFYLELDNESPGRIGQYLGWQIVRSYMKNNDVPLMTMLHKEADEIFKLSKFKPRK